MSKREPYQRLSPEREANMWANGERPPYCGWNDKPKDIIDEDTIDICLSINMLRKILGNVFHEQTSDCDAMEEAVDCFMAHHHFLTQDVIARTRGVGRRSFPKS